jgi:hypothetical protein
MVIGMAKIFQEYPISRFRLPMAITGLLSKASHPERTVSTARDVKNSGDVSISKPSLHTDSTFSARR